MPKYLVVGPCDFGMPGDVVELAEAVAAETNHMSETPVLKPQPGSTQAGLGTVAQGVESPLDKAMAMAREMADYRMAQQKKAVDAFLANQKPAGVKQYFTPVSLGFEDPSSAWKTVGGPNPAVGEMAPEPGELKLPEHLYAEVTDKSKQVDAELAKEVHDLANSLRPEGEEAPKTSVEPKAEEPKAEEPKAEEPKAEEPKAKKGGRKAAK